MQKFCFVIACLSCFHASFAKHSCEPDTQRGYKVEIASKAGKLLRRLNDISSSRCKKLCCDNDEDCSVAVWHYRSGSCELYSCPTELSCDLEPHGGYYMYIMDSSNGDRDSIQYKKGGFHYDKDYFNKGDDDDDDESRHSSSTRCRDDDDCRDELVGGECHDHKCRCPRHWKSVGEKCFKPCKHNEWECDDIDESDKVLVKKYSRCIARYDRCDGTRNCADGSDEHDCLREEDKTTTHSISKTTTTTLSTTTTLENNNGSSLFESGGKLASKFVNDINDLLPPNNDSKIAVVAVVLASFIAALGILVVVCRLWRASRLTYRRRRLVENIRKQHRGQRPVKHLFSTTEEEGDSLINNANAENGMFLM